MPDSQLDLSFVLDALDGARLAFPVSRPLAFAHAVSDSREAGPGSLFVALQGERDGHDFIADAYRRGASGVLAQRVADDVDRWLPAEQRPQFAYLLVEDSLSALQRLAVAWRDQCPVDVVGITGSVGKTTTKEVVAAVLGGRFRVHANERNFNNEIGLPLSLLRLGPEHQVAVLEMGMYGPGEIAALARLARPRLGVVTNVGPTHLERMGTLERTAAAKAELVEALPAEGLAILNGDDERVRAMAGRSRAPVLFYGLDRSNTLRASPPEVRGLEGIAFDLSWQGEVQHVQTPLMGGHSVYACLAAAAVALAKDMALAEVAAQLAALTPRLRLVVVPGRNGSRIIDDAYNAAPASMLAALDLLGSLPGRRIAVLGDMAELGSYERRGHEEVGRSAARNCDLLIAVGPRGRWIGEAAREAGLAAVEFAREGAEVHPALQPGDVVLVKGSRSMRMEEIVTSLSAAKDLQ